VSNAVIHGVVTSERLRDKEIKERERGREGEGE
jgi:hypothetical protein